MEEITSSNSWNEQQH